MTEANVKDKVHMTNYIHGSLIARYPHKFQLFQLNSFKDLLQIFLCKKKTYPIVALTYPSGSWFE